mmetsp:Transcript_40351/g.87090  ORF Transcript_40351/g.87090 Transcript_40351/m.87090 type:complete len:250 (-) Transcript_40351:1041-1790(-)
MGIKIRSMSHLPHWRGHIASVHQPSSEDHPGQHTQGVQVGSEVIFLMLQHLWCNVAGATCRDAETPDPGALDAEAAEAEVRELRDAIAIQHDILWLQVPQQGVHATVHVFEAQEHLANPLMGRTWWLVGSPVGSEFALCALDSGEEITSWAVLHHQHVEPDVCKVLHTEEPHETRMGHQADAVCHLALSCCHRHYPDLRPSAANVLDCIPCLSVVLGEPHMTIAAFANHGFWRNLGESIAGRIGSRGHP